MKTKNLRNALMLLLVFSFCGCNGKGAAPEADEAIYSVVKDEYIVRNGTSAYYIVIADDALENESGAANDLSYFLALSTGAKVPVITEDEALSTYKYISIGETAQFESACSDIDMSSLERSKSGYFITTRDDNIYINAGRNFYGDATAYGVYDLLEALIGYRYYAKSEIHYETKENVNLLDYKDTFIHPDYDMRSYDSFDIANDETHRRRLRVINMGTGNEWFNKNVMSGFGSVISLAGHNQISYYIQPNAVDEYADNGKTYYENHPDWFLNSMSHTFYNQLCWTAGEEMEDIIVDKMTKFMLEDTEATYFMLGQEDTKSYCTCDRCTAAISEWAGNAAGLQIAFMNHIVEKCEAWITKNQPGREITYVIYAYNCTVEPPVKSDGKGGYAAISEKVIPNEKLDIMFAPIGAYYGYTLDSKTNQETLEQLKGWCSLAPDQVMVYAYDLNYHYYFVNFNNFNSIGNWFRVCKEYGVKYMFPQGAITSQLPCFADMRQYVECSLMWDSSDNYDDLAKDFITHYYKDAAEDIWSFYTDHRDRYAEYLTLTDPAGGNVYSEIVNSDLWPFSFLKQLEAHITSALEKIDHYQEEDPGMYTKLYYRVMREYLEVLFLEMKLYKTRFSSDEIAEKKALFEDVVKYVGITYVSEGAQLSVDDIF